MELLLIPFLLLSGGALIYLGVHGVPTAPWALTSGRHKGKKDATAASVGPRKVVEATAQTIQLPAPASGGPAASPVKRNVLKDVRPRRQTASMPLSATEPETPAEVSDTSDSAPEVRPEDVLSPSEAVPARAISSNDGPANEDTLSAAKKATANSAGPSPLFSESDALMGQLLMELSSVRGEISDLRSRVERLTVRPAALTRAPGGPRRRRMRRVSRF